MTKIKMLGAAATTALALSAAVPAFAQVDKRAAEFTHMQLLLTQGDANKRSAELEAIVNGGDRLKTELAIRVAAASDDARLRSLAMLGYMKHVDILRFAIRLAPPVQQTLDKAAANPQTLKEFLDRYSHIREIHNVNYRFEAAFTDVDTRTGRGQVALSTHDGIKGRRASFQVVGDRVQFTVMTYVSGAQRGECAYEFRATKELRLYGTLACPSWGNPAMPPVTITADMY
jgi:hypothetical protein